MNPHLGRIALWVFVTFLATNCAGDLVFANGFKILGVKSTKATAMGEAFIVQSDDPTAIAFNPAGLTQVKGTQLSIGSTYTNSWIKHTSAKGGLEEYNKDKWQNIPNFFITSDFKRDDITAGIGITLPNGISSEWSETSFARYVATFSELILIDVNPSVAYQVDEHLSIGAGISYYYSSAQLDSLVDYGSLIGQGGLFDGKGELEAEGESWGYNLGVLYKINKQHSIAATFKSPFRVKYEGEAYYTRIPGFMGRGPSMESDVNTVIQFPAVIVAGYAYRPTDKLKMEFNLDWTNWRSLDSVELNFSHKLLNNIFYRYEYENTLAYKIGLEYSVTEDLKLRGGYIYNENAVPQGNWRPSLPDTDMHFVCSGFGCEIGKFTIDGAVQMIFFNERIIDNNVDNNETSTISSIDGKYENFGLGFSLGATYKF